MDGETKGFLLMKSLPVNREYMIGKMKWDYNFETII
jgi:predicted Mrr-cat superfamily restriction endonuclease